VISIKREGSERIEENRVIKGNSRLLKDLKRCPRILYYKERRVNLYVR
jgi:hypothetical protein